MAWVLDTLEDFGQFGAGSSKPFNLKGFSSLLTITQDSALNNRYYATWGSTQYTLRTGVYQRIRMGFRGYNGSGVYFRTGLSGAVHVSIAWSAASGGTITANFSTGTLIQTVTSTGWASNTYFHMEVDIWVADSPNGFFKIWYNGALVINQTGIDTKNHASLSTIGVVEMQGTPRIADFWVLGDSNSDSTPPMTGDLAIYGVAPTINGNYNSQFTLSSGTDGYAVLDDVPPDGDTSYAESSIVDHRISVKYPSLSNTPKGVSFCDYMRKTDAGSRGVKRFIRQGSTDYEPDADIALGDSYTVTQKSLLTLPDGNPLTASDVSNLEHGIRIAS